MNGKYNTVDTVEKLKELDKILADKDLLAVDTETNGILLYRSTVVGFSISFNRHSGYYIPLLKWVPIEKSLKKRKKDKVEYMSYMDGYLQCVWTGEKFDEFVKPEEYNISQRFPLIPALAQRWFKGKRLIMWNAPFDRNMIYTNFQADGKPLDLKDEVFIDPSLMTHALDENESTALKPSAERFKTQLGINPHVLASQEKKELFNSIIINGGDKAGQVWRASLEYQSKYACADTFLTFGMAEEAMKAFGAEYGQEGIKWFMEDEVMPVCTEVVMDMKSRGIYTDVEHFKVMYQETGDKLNEIEDKIIGFLSSEGLLDGFDLGKTLDEAVSNQRFIKRVIELENLKIPQKYDKKREEWKDTLAKGEVKKAYAKDPHWVWGYILGEDEIKYSDKKIEEIKQELYQEVENKRYRFNIRSVYHLRWLFCDKLGMNPASLPQTDSATKKNPIPKMNAETLTEYMLPKYPWVSDILFFKKIDKLQSSYISNAVNLHHNGWLYMDMKQNGTKSGRFSCSGGFNLQTLPKVEEIDKCPSCKSKNIQVEHPIKLLANMKCQNCGHEETDILCPSAIKEGFIAPPGYKIVNADYSSLEPRCFAFNSSDEKIKAVYKEGLDLYSKIYCDMFPDGSQYSANPEDPNFLKKVANDKRDLVKPVVLGIPYGSSDVQVANMIGATKEIIDRETGERKIIPDKERGAEIRNLYLATFPDLHQYMKEQERKAVEEGIVTTLVGRRRHFKYAKCINDILKKHRINYKDITETSPYILKKGNDLEFISTVNPGIKVNLTKDIMTEIKKELDLDWDKIILKGYWAYIRNLMKSDINEACNNPIQGLAAHITNKGMLETNRAYRVNGIDGWVCLQVHDEITAYVREDQTDIGVELMKKAMEDNQYTRLIDIPMIADPIVCDTLKESK